MVSHQMPPPKNFNFSQPEEWPKWIWRFQRFRQASRLSDKSSENQVNTLVYTMGDVTDDILYSLVSLMMRKRTMIWLCRDLNKKRNIIVECAKSNQRKQEEGKSVDDFVTALHCLSEHCQYGELCNKMIHNRIVVELCDSNISEKLQLEAILRLKKLL